MSDSIVGPLRWARMTQLRCHCTEPHGTSCLTRVCVSQGPDSCSGWLSPHQRLEAGREAFIQPVMSEGRGRDHSTLLLGSISEPLSLAPGVLVRLLRKSSPKPKQVKSELR